MLNDALSIYFADATLASAFVARWCVVAKVGIAGGVFQMREDEPKPRVGGEITSANGTTDQRWTVMAWAWTPLGDFNARSGIGLSDRVGSLHPNLGANLAADAQRLER